MRPQLPVRAMVRRQIHDAFKGRLDARLTRASARSNKEKPMATTTTTKTHTSSTPTTKSHRVGHFMLAGGLAIALASTAVLADKVFRDDSPTNAHTVAVVGPFNGLPNVNELGMNTPTPAVVVPGPYNELPNLNDLGVTPVPSPNILVPGPYNGLPNLNDLGVTVPTVGTRAGH
jgi:hypothetical protein